MAADHIAAIKAAAWAAVAALEANKAVELLSAVIEEIRSAQWNGR